MISKLRKQDIAAELDYNSKISRSVSQGYQDSGAVKTQGDPWFNPARNSVVVSSSEHGGIQDKMKSFIKA